MPLSICPHCGRKTPSERDGLSAPLECAYCGGKPARAAAPPAEGPAPASVVHVARELPDAESHRPPPAGAGRALDGGPDFRRLLRGTAAALLLCAALVAACYSFVDRPVAFYVHAHNDAYQTVLRWLTYPPPVLQTWTPVVLAVLMVRRAWGPFARWERAALAACVSIVLADQFRATLGYAFGRDWPETWVRDNPSLIGDGAYGFHPFHGGRGYASFPSGHTARTLGVAAVVWIAYPRWRWVCVAASGGVALGLLGMDYHFVSDVIAGGFVGGIVAAYTAAFCGLKE